MADRKKNGPSMKPRKIQICKASEKLTRKVNAFYEKGRKILQYNTISIRISRFNGELQKTETSAFGLKFLCDNIATPFLTISAKFTINLSIIPIFE